MLKEQVFWEWFENNQELIFNFEDNQEEILDLISVAIKEVHSDLVFEISTIINDKREFVISADGIKEAFPFVESLYEKAPNLTKWTFLKFRPRMTIDFGIRFQGFDLTTDDIKFKLEQDDDKIGISLFFPCEDDEETVSQFRHIAYLFLDSLLGEYDVETKVGFIEIFSDNSNWNVKKKVLKELPDIFDKKYQSLFN
jgi:hypothetical protein